MIEIDGAYGEGGGAIVRQAVALAAYSGRAVRVTRIRAGRPQPGLKPQHVKAVEALAALSGARVDGARVGSTELAFAPGPLVPGAFRFDVGTAGAATLVLQALLLPCLCHGGEFTIEVIGGTDVPWSPSADYLASVTLPVLAPFGAARLTIERRGYYPKGGGRVCLLVRGTAVPPGSLTLVERGPIRAVHGVSHAARILRDRHVANRQAEAARETLQPLGVPATIRVEYGESYSVGSGITLWTESPAGPALGGSALGARGKRAEDVGRDAARALLAEIEAGGAVDRYLADQLVPFLAVSGGAVSASEVTSHARSNMYVAETILDARFRVEGRVVTATPPPRAHRPSPA